MERLAFSDEAGLEKHLGATEALAADSNDMPSGSSYFVFLSELSVVSHHSVSQASDQIAQANKFEPRCHPRASDGLVVRNLQRPPKPLCTLGTTRT